LTTLLPGRARWDLPQTDLYVCMCVCVFVYGHTGFTERRIPDTITNKEEINSMVSWESGSYFSWLEFKGQQWTEENAL